MKTSEQLALSYYTALKKHMSTKRATQVGLAEDELTVRYHDTIVFRYYVDHGDVELDTGGWYTHTTKERINDALRICNIPATVYQHTRPKRADDPPWADAEYRRRWFVWFRQKGEHRVVLDGSLSFKRNYCFPFGEDTSQRIGAPEPLGLAEL